MGRVGVGVAEAGVGDTEAGFGGEDAGEQRLGVGVQRGGEDLVHWGALDDAAEIHDGDVGGDVFDDGEVVADEKERQAEVAAEFGEEIEDLGLDGDVEGAGGFVADDDAGAQDQGAGDGDALALAAAELVGVAVGHVGGEADAAEDGEDAVIHVALALGAQGEGDDVADALAGVERGVGVLEDRLDQAGAGATVERVEALTGDGDAAAVGWDQAEDQAGQGALAAAALADNAHDAAFSDGQVDAVDGLDRAEAAGEVADLDDHSRMQR